MLFFVINALQTYGKILGFICLSYKKQDLILFNCLVLILVVYCQTEIKLVSMA